MNEIDSATVGPAPAKINLVIYRGSAFDFQFELADVNDDPLDLTGYTMHADIVSEEDGAEVFDLSPTFTTASSGLGQISLTNVQTLTLTAGRYLWNLLLEDGNGLITGPHMEGSVVIKAKRSDDA